MKKCNCSVTGEGVCNQIKISRWVVLVDGLEQAQLPSGVAGSGSQGQRLPISYPQRPREPDLVFSPAVFQRGGSSGAQWETSPEEGHAAAGFLARVHPCR